MRNNPTHPPLLVGTREAARMLGVSERTLYAMRTAGRIPYVPVGADGTSVRYSVEALRDWIAQQQQSASPGK